MTGGAAAAEDGADDEGVVRSSMRHVPDTSAPAASSEAAPAASSEAVGGLAARVKTPAMRWATGCCETRQWRLGTLAAALLVVAAPAARAGDTGAAEPAPQQRV